MRDGYAVVDVETTGIHPGWHHRIAEIAVVHLDASGIVTDEWCTLLNPGRDLGPQRIHGISAAEIRRAPTFGDVAGDVAARLAGRVVVAHHLTFDVRFLVAEFHRVGVNPPLDATFGLCTMRLASRFLQSVGRSLTSCCDAASVPFTNAHSALYDARAAAALMAHYLAAVGRRQPWSGLLDAATQRPWPALPTAFVAPVLRRGDFVPEPDFISRLVDALPSSPDNADADDYLAVLDTAMIDRHLSETEQDELVATAAELGLCHADVLVLHRDYLAALARLAWQDGVVTGAELSDLHLAADLLGLSHTDADIALSDAQHAASNTVHNGLGHFRLARGDTVVLTGDMDLPREMWLQRAAAAGLSVNGKNVTKRTRLLIAADPDSLSRKAKKARDYGIPIVTETAFHELLTDLEGGPA